MCPQPRFQVAKLPRLIHYSVTICYVSLALGNEVGGTWGQEVHILHINI